MFKCCVVALTLCIVSTSAAYAVMISGDADCGTWVTARKANGAGILEAYVTGALNGTVVSLKKEFWHAGGQDISREAAFVWIDNYCQSHPLNALMEAIVGLFAERTGLQVISPK